MQRTKLKYESKQRAITQKQVNKSYASYVLHSPLMRSIHPQNFITIASTVLEICTGQNSSRKIKGNNSKIKQARVTVHVHCTPPLMRSIHPRNFITIASIVLETCSGQNSSMKLNKGQ